MPGPVGWRSIPWLAHTHEGNWLWWQLADKFVGYIWRCMRALDIFWTSQRLRAVSFYFADTKYVLLFWVCVSITDSRKVR